MKSTIDYFRDEPDVTTYAAGETIFLEGESGDVMYGVREGTVDLIHDGQVLETVEAKGIFGEMALVSHEPRSATAIAQTDCTIVPMDEAHFIFKVQHNPLFALFIMRVMSERLRLAVRRRE